MVTTKLVYLNLIWLLTKTITFEAYHTMVNQNSLAVLHSTKSCLSQSMSLGEATTNPAASRIKRQSAGLDLKTWPSVS